jgi:hypothetical protein
MTEQLIYRLTWEMISPHKAVEFDMGVLRYDDIPEDMWYPVGKERAQLEGDNLAGFQEQYETLKEWEKHKQQPVRKVKLEKGVMPEIQWQEVTTCDV